MSGSMNGSMSGSMNGPVNGDTRDHAADRAIFERHLEQRLVTLTRGAGALGYQLPLNDQGFSVVCRATQIAWYEAYAASYECGE